MPAVLCDLASLVLYSRLACCLLRDERGIAYDVLLQGSVRSSAIIAVRVSSTRDMQIIILRCHSCEMKTQITLYSWSLFKDLEETSAFGYYMIFCSLAAFCEHGLE